MVDRWRAFPSSTALYFSVPSLCETLDGVILGRWFCAVRVTMCVIFATSTGLGTLKLIDRQSARLSLHERRILYVTLDGEILGRCYYGVRLSVRKSIRRARNNISTDPRRKVVYPPRPCIFSVVLVSIPFISHLLDRSA